MNEAETLGIENKAATVSQVIGAAKDAGLIKVDGLPLSFPYRNRGPSPRLPIKLSETKTWLLKSKLMEARATRILHHAVDCFM